jgi:hypothetical protein
MNRRILPLAAAASLLSSTACTAESDPAEAVATATSAATSGFLSGSTGAFGYYTYPARTMTFAAAPGCSFASGSVSVQALDVPNRFTVRDANDVIVASSAWLGNATYGGPWGAYLPLSNPSTATLRIPRAGTFRLIVETSAQKYGLTDAWEASFSSTDACVAPPGDDDPVDPVDPVDPPGCVDAISGSTMNGAAPAGIGYYRYTDRTFHASLCAPRKLIVAASALDVPNRVSVYDANDLLVASSSWLGSSDTPGPWGMSLSNSGTASLMFPGKTGTYRVVVETVTSDRSDYWEASVY